MQLPGRTDNEAVVLPPNGEDRLADFEKGLTVRMIAVVRAVLSAKIPVGHENETGFHYGPELMV